MRWPSYLLPLFLGGILPSQAQGDLEALTLTNSLFTLDGTLTTSEPAAPTGPYQTYSSTVTLSTDGSLTSATLTGTGSAMETGSMSHNASSSYTTTTSDSLTVLVGGMQTSIIGNSSANATNTASASPSGPSVINTQPCNGYAELCSRKYSNVTMVAAHNSPFVKQANVAANQVLDVQSQLNDGIRMCRPPPFSIPV